MGELTVQNSQSIARTSESPWQPPPWLDQWQTSHPVPVSQETVSANLAAVQNMLRPVDPKVAAALLAQTVAIFGVPANWKQIADFYLEALEDVPPDLALLAMKRIRMEKKFFPKPAEIREVIANELAVRRTTEMRLKHALWRTQKAVG